MEIAPGVFIAYAAHDFTENLHIVGEETLLHPFADQAAEDAAEIFMPGIAQEAAAVGKHAHESGQIPQVRQADQLLGHALQVVVEPPGGAVLNLGHRLLALEAAANAVDGLIVVGIEAVEHGLGQVAHSLQRAEERGGLGGGSVVVDAVKAGIRPQAIVHGAVVVPAAAVVQLHGPVALPVLMRREEHECGLEYGLLAPGHSIPREAFAEDRFYLFLGCGGVHHVIERMLAQTAAVLGKVIHPFAQRFLQAAETVDGYARYGGEPGQVVDIIRLLQIHGFVWPPGGQDGGVEGIIRGQLLVPFQGIDGVIRGADGFDVAHRNQAAHAVAGLCSFRLHRFHTSSAVRALSVPL